MAEPINLNKFRKAKAKAEKTSWPRKTARNSDAPSPIDPWSKRARTKRAGRPKPIAGTMIPKTMVNQVLPTGL